MPKKGSKPITRLQVREMALAAIVDDRTLVKFLRGERVHDFTRERIKRAFEEKEMTHLLPVEARR